jgi:thiosulfate/3-mercaptopyruvate sulfurtransferase
MTEPPLPLVAEPEQLHSLLQNERLLIVDLSDPAIYQQRHIPGAINLPYPLIIRAQPPAMGLVPAETELSRVFSAIGLTPETHVIAYDSEGNGRASRLLWTLDALGHNHLSLLNGGLQAWQSAGYPLEAGIVDPRPSAYVATIRRPEVIADRDYIMQHLNDTNTVILDARSPKEYSGIDQRAARSGHIPNAVNVEWIQTMDPERDRRFKSMEALRQLYAAAGITPDKDIIVHCQTHHRSAHTYIALKSLGFTRVRGYPGSWSEWGNLPDTPIER